MGEIDTCERATRSYKGKIKEELRHQIRLKRKTAPSSIAWSGVKQKTAALHLWKERTPQKVQHLDGTRETNSSADIRFSAS